MDRAIIRNVVAIIAQRGWEERHQPDGIDPQIPQIVELLSEALEIPNAVAIAIVKRADVHLIENCVLIPKSVLHFLQKRPPQGVCTRVIELVTSVDLEIETTLSAGR